MTEDRPPPRYIEDRVDDSLPPIGEFAEEWAANEWPPRDPPRDPDRRDPDRRDPEAGQHLIWVLLAGAIMVLIYWW